MRVRRPTRACGARINEDSFLAASPLFLVADGMGGHHAGEIASATVIDEFDELAGRASLTIDDVHAAFDRARVACRVAAAGRRAPAPARP